MHYAVILVQKHNSIT